MANESRHDVVVVDHKTRGRAARERRVLSGAGGGDGGDAYSPSQPSVQGDTDEEPVMPMGELPEAVR